MNDLRAGGNVIYFRHASTDSARLDRPRLFRRLRRLLSSTPAVGTNLIIVGRVSSLSQAAQTTVGEGEAAVFRPDGTGGFTLTAPIAADEWASLLAQ